MMPKSDISKDEVRQSATIIVSARTSKKRTQADFICVGEDDHLVIQAALNALPAAGGRVVLLDGEFLITGTIMLPSNTTLEGQGRATTIKAAVGIPVPTQILTIQAGRSGIVVKNLKLDGDGKAFSCFNIYTKPADANATHDIRFERCDIRHGYDRCGLSWSTHPTFTNYDLSFIDCVFGPRKDMAGDPVDPILDIDQSSDVLIRGCRFLGNKAHTNYPLLIIWSDLDAGNPACERILVVGNIFRNSGRECLWFTGVNGLKVQSNIFYDCVGEAVAGRDVKSLDFDISDNLIWKCGPDVAGCVSLGEPELEFTGRFAGNTIRSPLAGGLLVSGFGHIQVINNTFRDMNPAGKSWAAGGFVLSAETNGAGLFEFRGNILHEMHVNTTPVLLDAKEAMPVARLHFYDNLLNVGTISVSPKFRGFWHPTLGIQANDELFEILKDFSTSFRCENNKYISTAESARTPLKSGKPSFTAFSLVFDLSGGAMHREVFRAKTASILHGFDVVYTEASSAHDGVTIQVGKYSEGVAPDYNFFHWTVSEVSKGKGYTKSFIRTHLAQSAIASGEIVICGVEGGKVGAGEVMLCLHIEAGE